MNRTLSIVKEKSWGKTHEVISGAPCEWSQVRGATHTLLTRDGTRPAKLLKTVMYVGVDEISDDVKWEKWDVKPYLATREVSSEQVQFLLNECKRK